MSTTHASAYLRSAHQRLAHAVTAADLPAFSLFPAACDFIAMRDHLRELTTATDEYIAACAREIESNMTRNFPIHDYLAVTSTGLESSGLIDAIEAYAER